MSSPPQSGAPGVPAGDDYTRLIRALKLDDQDIRKICDVCLAEKSPPSDEICKALMHFYVRNIRKKSRTGPQLAQKVDDFVERNEGNTLTEIRRMVAEFNGVSMQRVERAHQRYGKRKGRNKPGHSKKQ